MIYSRSPIGVVVAHLWVPADGPGFDPRIGHFYSFNKQIDQENFFNVKIDKIY